jgi:type IV pilus assembly protein PilN
MIRINLLPVKQKQRQYTVVYQLVVGGVIVMIMLAGCTIDHLLQLKTLHDKQAQVQKLDREIAELERLIGEVKQFEQKKAELQRKLDVINNLKNNKVGPVHLLEELSVNIPKKAWLTAIKETTTGPASHQVSLTGEAISDEVIAEFMTKLGESEYFKNVNLIEARSAGEKQGVSTQSFQITCDMVIPQKPAGGQQASAAPTN